MEVAIYKTYAKKKAGGFMHFDIIVAKETSFEAVLVYGATFIRSRLQDKAVMLTRDCRFYHVTDVIPRWEKLIQSQGYYIHELEGCH
ncbi:DUF2024 family protein [Chitinophaga solisilvae]|uniref:DUF2024 family protein n=1 Tax=Chitinophaga solisilvae TaxID=1233460 RepID=UPI0013710A9A|nr:DUF2024 family protein [Chitinophaga solisilvae]